MEVHERVGYLIDWVSYETFCREYLANNSVQYNVQVCPVNCRSQGYTGEHVWLWISSSITVSGWSIVAS